MALNLVAVLPPLNNVQKILESYANKYGRTIYVDPNNTAAPQTGVKPSLQANIYAMSGIAQHLVEYSTLKQSIKSVYLGNYTNTKTYCFSSIMLVSLVTFATLAFFLWNQMAGEQPRWQFCRKDKSIKEFQAALHKYMNGEYTQIPKEEKEEELELQIKAMTSDLLRVDVQKLIQFLIKSILIIVISTYLISLATQIWKKSAYAYSDNPDHNNSLYFFESALEQQSEISKVVQLFYLDANNVITASNASIMWAYNFTSPPSATPFATSANAATTTSQSAQCASSQAPTPASTTATSSTIPTEVVYVGTFDGGQGPNNIDPYLLKKQLQSFDIFGQISRMQTAITYLQSNLYLQFDATTIQATMTTDSRQQINDSIVALLTTNATIVTDLKAPSTGTNVYTNVTTPSACFCLALNDTTSKGAAYDSNAKTCYLMHSSSSNSAWIYTPDATNTQQVLLNKDNTITISTGSMDMNNYNKLTAITTPSSTNNSLEYATAGAAGTTYFTPSAGNLNYSTLFNVTTSVVQAGGTFTLTKNTNDIINYQTTQNAMLTYNVANGWFQTNIVSTIIAADPTNQYTFMQSDQDYIVSKVVAKLGSSFNGLVTNILTNISTTLIQKQNEQKATATTDPITTKYISLDTFTKKVANLNSEDFVTNLLFYSEEIRACSHGLSYMNQSYNVPIKTNDNSKNTQLQNYTQSVMTIIAIGAIIMFIVSQVMDPTDGVNVKIIKINLAIKELEKSNPETDMHIEDVDAEKLKERKIKKLKNQKISLWASMVLKTSLAAALSMIIISIIFNSIDKKNSISDYNQLVLNANGSIITDKSSGIMSAYFTDSVIANAYQIKSVAPVSANMIHEPKLYLDPWLGTDTTTSTNFPTNDLLFQTIVQNTNISNTLTLNTNSSSTNLETIYYSYIDIIEAYGKCNSLFSMSQTSFPFPTIEITVYGIVLLICFAVLAMLTSWLNPTDNMDKIRRFNILLARAKEGKKTSRDDFDDDDMNFGEDEKEEDTANTNILMFGAAILVLVFGVIFVFFVSGSGKSFKTTLLSSPMYSKSQCFPPQQ